MRLRAASPDLVARSIRASAADEATMSLEEAFSSEAVREALAASPLSSACGVALPLSPAALSAARAQALAAARALGLPPSRASATRVAGYYLPIFHWIVAQREEWAKSGKGGAEGVEGAAECSPEGAGGCHGADPEAGHEASPSGGRARAGSSAAWRSPVPSSDSVGSAASELGSHARGRAPLFVLGISAPQGCGKTTLVTALTAMARAAGLRAAGISLDDVYLTGAEQDAVAARGNPLLASRGNAGTHDLALLRATLRALAEASPARPALVPRYDKAARGGRGDRAPREAWERVDAVPDIVLLEGWMLGFRGGGAGCHTETEGAEGLCPGGAHGEASGSASGHEGLCPESSRGSTCGPARARDAPCPEGPRGSTCGPALARALAEIDALLSSRYDAIWRDDVASWLVVRVSDPAVSRRWRLEAEHAQKARGLPGMTDAQVERFMQCYIPVYRAYLPELYAKGPPGNGGVLTVTVDEQRRPVAAARGRGAEGKA